MTPEMIEQVMSLGIAGLLFVMWWLERAERQREVRGRERESRDMVQLSDVHGRLLDVVKANTEVLVALREDLRSGRATELEWLTRLHEQLARLEDLTQKERES